MPPRGEFWITTSIYKRPFFLKLAYDYCRIFLTNVDVVAFTNQNKFKQTIL